MSAGLIDFGRGEVVPFAELLDEILELVGEDAEALKCSAEIENLRDILDRGNGADRQRAVRSAELKSSRDETRAMQAVVRNLIDEFTVDL
jgi:carboxylate-amine ligase